MAVLKAEVDFNFGPIIELARIFPDMNGRLLSLIGKRSRILLKEDFLSGQEINLTAYPRDKRGRFTVISNVNKKRDSVSIYSYPVNLFERGRVLRNGRKEKGKHIITRKLKQAVMGRSASYVGEFEGRILGPEIKKVGL